MKFACCLQYCTRNSQCSNRYSSFQGSFEDDPYDDDGAHIDCVAICDKCLEQREDAGCIKFPDRDDLFLIDSFHREND